MNPKLAFLSKMQRLSLESLKQVPGSLPRVDDMVVVDSLAFLQQPRINNTNDS